MATERLELVISTKGGRTVERQLTGIGDQAQKAGARTQKMGDSIDRGASRGSRALRRTQNEMRRTGNEAARTSGRITSMMTAFTVPTAAAASLRNMSRGLRGLAGAVSGFYAGRYLAQAFDDFTRIQNSLKGFGVGAGSIDRVTDALTDLANEARVSSVETATLFGRLRLATRDLGATEADVLELTGTLNKALRLSGSSGLEASQSVRQLSQAFNKGKLDGDEFRSVLENAPILTKLLTKELKISKGELYDWAAAGKITTKILSKAIKEGSADIDAAFKKLRPTIGDAFTNLFNNIRRFVGTTPEVGSAVSVLTDAITLLGENLNVVLGIFEAYAGIFVAGKVIALFSGMTKGAKALSAALKGLAASQALVGGSSLLAGAGAAGAGAAGAGAAGAGAAAAAAGAQRGFPAVLAGPGSIRSFGKFGTNVRSSVRPGTGALPIDFSKTKSSVTSLSTLIGTRLFFEITRIGLAIKSVASSALGLLRPFNVVGAIIASIVLKMTGGFLDGLKDATRETTRWSAATKAVGLAWQTMTRYAKAFFSASGSFLGGLLETAAGYLNKALTGIAEGIFIAIKLFIQAIGDLVRYLADLQDSINEMLGSFGISGADTGPARRWAGLFSEPLPEGTDYIDLAKKFKDEFYKDRGEVDGSSGGVLGAVTEAFNALGDLSAAAGRKFIESLDTQDAINTYKDALREAEESAGRIKDLLKSEDGAASFLSPDEISKQVQQLEDLLKAYSSEGFEGSTKLTASDVSSIVTAEGALKGITKFLADSAASLSAFDATVREAGGNENELRQALGKLDTEFRSAAEKLPPAARDAAIEASEKMVSEAKAVLDSGATDIGASVRAAFIAGFGGALGNLLNNVNTLDPKQQLDGSSGANLGLPPNLSRQGIDESIGDAGKPKIDEANRAAQSYGGTIRGLTSDVRNFSTAGAEAFKQAGGSAKNAANDIQQFFEGAFSSLEDALVGFVTTGKLDFKSLINSIIADLARMVIRMLIIKPLMGFFGGIFGFSGGGVVPGFKNGGQVQAFAPGGIVSGFGGARSDNQLAALSPGEMVINAGSTKQNLGALEYINKTGKMPSSGGGGDSVVFAPNITINESGNDPQVTAQMVDAAVRRSWDELAVKSQRKGGIFDRSR